MDTTTQEEVTTFDTGRGQTLGSTSALNCMAVLLNETAPVSRVLTFYLSTHLKEHRTFVLLEALQFCFVCLIKDCVFPLLLAAKKNLRFSTDLTFFLFKRPLKP